MDESSKKYALAALKDRRASLAGEIASLKKQIKWRVDQLTHLDATLRLLDPQSDPTRIRTKRPQRIKLFKQGQLNRLIFDALRRAGHPLSMAEIIIAVMTALGHAEAAHQATRSRVRWNITYPERERNAVVKSGNGKSVRWVLAEAA